MTVFENLKEKYFKDADSLARFLLMNEEDDERITHDMLLNSACFYMEALGKCAYGTGDPVDKKWCVDCLRAWLESEWEAEE